MDKKNHKRAEIAISSTCLGSVDIESLCEYAAINNIRCIELSANISFISNRELIKTLERYSDRIAFYIHNYFPAPKNPFVLNLAHSDTYKRSLEHCLRAVDLCSALGIKIYSVHAGLAINPSPVDLGKSLACYTPLDFEESRGMLMSACHDIAEYALNKGVQLLIENNVINEGNCPRNVNNAYHFADPDESENLLPLFSHQNIGILLDFGHLKVNAENLDFEPYDFISLFREKISAAHLSDNNGRHDQNLHISAESWFWPYLPWEQLEYISLEIKDCSPGMIEKQLEIIQRQMDRYAGYPA